MQKQPYLLILSGPTASGKTGLSLQLAQFFDTVILSADSRQFYRELSIGTAKPTPEERAQARHYFIDSKSIGEEYSVGDYEREAIALLEELFSEKKLVLLVGGSGLFIQAVCKGLDQFPDIPKMIREELNQQFQEKGIVALQEELKKADPIYYEEVDLQNPQRLIRALEVCRASGQAFSSFRKSKKSPRPFIPIYLQMQWPRPLLYQRINQRVDQMIEEGLLEEVKKVAPHQNQNALQTVGYQEFFPVLRGEAKLEEAIELLKRNTRRYAKRQMTWNRRSGHWKHFHPSEVDQIKAYLDWVINGNQQLHWKKETDTAPSLLGVQRSDKWEAVLQVAIQKKKVFVEQMEPSPQNISEQLRYFLLQEIASKYLDKNIQVQLSYAWQSALIQAGYQQSSSDQWFLLSKNL